MTTNLKEYTLLSLGDSFTFGDELLDAIIKKIQMDIFIILEVEKLG